MKQILIIDDEYQVREMLRQLLERENYSVLLAANGDEAIKIIRENSVDLVITDIIMPEKEGLETILEIVKGYKDIQIIAISGGMRIGPGENLKIAKRFGAKYTFQKPVSNKELLKAVKDLLSP